MIRNLLLVCVFAITPLLAQPQSSQAPAAGATPQMQPQPPAPVAPDAAVVTIHGICPAGQNSSGTKSATCTMVLTRQQFEALVSSVNVTNQNFSLPALRSLAESYVTVLTLADAGEKAGVDKDPRFQELMKVARIRVLADAYRRSLQEKYRNPAAEEIEAYYKQNIGKFEQVRIERILVPRVNPKRSQDKPAEFEKKARQVADDVRERAARGEDIGSLQAEVYSSLGIQAMPPQTELNANQKASFTPAVRQDINALKAGEVTRVEVEPSGYNIYKIRSRSTLPLEQARPQIVQELSQKNLDAALKTATSGVHSEFNEQYFSPRPTGAPQAPRALPGSPTGHTGVHVNVPPSSATPGPATGASAPAPQKPASPK